MANDMNSVQLIGRLVREAELKSTQGGTSILRFSIAVNRRKKVQDQWTDEVSYFDIVLWGKAADSLKQYLNKGTQVAITGELHQSRWEQDGQQRSRVEIYANAVELLGKADGNTSGSQPTPAPQSSQTESFEEHFDDDKDIPF